MAKGTRVVWATVALMAAMALAAGPARAAECRLLVHDALSPDALSRKMVKGIFLGEVRFVGPVRVVPFTYGEGSKAERAFVTRCLGLSGDAFRLGWVRLVFREGVAPPRVVDTATQMLAAVSGTPGAIGYLAPEGAKTPDLPPKVQLLVY